MINSLSKDIVVSDKVLCNKILHSLMEITLTSCSPETYNDYDEEFRMHAFKTLENMCMLVPRKNTPNDSGETERIRLFFATHGNSEKSK